MSRWEIKRVDTEKGPKVGKTRKGNGKLNEKRIKLSREIFFLLPSLPNLREKHRRAIALTGGLIEFMHPRDWRLPAKSGVHMLGEHKVYK